MGYPVEQQKYQSLGRLVLALGARGEVTGYRHQLHLDTAVVTTTYTQDGVRFMREVFVSPVDQVIVVRLTADRPGAIWLTAQLRGQRNEAHSDYATDYFRMDGYGPDGLIVRGKSADYLAIEGRLRYESRLKAVADGGTVTVDDDTLAVRGADALTLLVAAATSFVNYNDVSADPHARVDAVMNAVAGKRFDAIRSAHLDEHRRLFRRVAIDLGVTADSRLPTDERLAKAHGADAPALPALLFQFGRYLLISSSRPGTQPANCRGSGTRT